MLEYAKGKSDKLINKKKPRKLHVFIIVAKELGSTAQFLLANSASKCLIIHYTGMASV